ncbi:DNA replication/repair protein RecF [Amnibacterium flavum]|uniref:DNA replication and repair protein RecF n=1 Tax=Amnibacterium flavum TaxID=2173173 RepID=A0A2V1HXS4_9MICO|nr:DNA replication/repair protein RecF [Amnibacterium flavum]PVZ95487.1 DNA replication/repair protein RecF [Amnibacterium flavum]
MRVRHLNLVDFRNYEVADVDLHPGINVFVGSNGQGKTNLVESLGYISSLGSHRVSTDQALVRQGRDSAIVRALLAHGDREILVELQINASAANKAQVGRSPAKVRDLPRYLSSVLFAPEDLALVRGEPAGRRRMLDQLLVLRTPRLAGVISDFDRVLRQRNTLLKTARATGLKGDRLSTLDIWDERLVEFGSEIIRERLALVDDLRGHLQSAYLAIAGADHSPRISMQLSIMAADPDADDRGTARVESSLPLAEISESFRQTLARVRPRELDRAITLVGPHRDDLLFELNSLPAKGYASHGESWSFALSMRLAAAELVREQSAGGDPVLILDDVFAELDQPRRERLARAVAGYEQVLVTAAVEADIPETLRGQVIRIKAGRILDDDPSESAAVAASGESDGTGNGE